MLWPNPVTRIAIDTGGSGKLAAEDWRKMSTLPIEAAKKSLKASQISVLNGDLQAGKLKFCRDKNITLINDLMVLERDHDRADRGQWVYKRGSRDHLADGLQYAYNLCFHHTYDPALDDRVKIDTPEYYERLEKQLEEAQVQRVKDRQADEGSIFSLLQ